MIDIDEIIKESLKFSSKTNKGLNDKMISKYSESTKKGKKIPKWAVVVIIPAVVACISAGTYIAVGKGFFRDKSTITGTVIGQAYENATDEIEVASNYSDGILHITLNLLKSNTVPYSVLDEIKPYDCTITNLSDGTTEDIQFDYAVVNENNVDIAVNFDATEDTEYKLEIRSFLGSKKADQPLEINGKWETVFKAETSEFPK